MSHSTMACRTRDLIVIEASDFSCMLMISDIFKMPEIQLPEFLTNIDWSERRNKVTFN